MEEGIEFPFDQSPHAADFDGVLTDPVFEDMLAERWLRVENAQRDAVGLKAITEEIVMLIEAELERQGS